LRNSSNNQDAEAMMDEIASAQSSGELVWLRSEVERRFAAHPRRSEVERLIDLMVPVVAVLRAAPNGTGQ